MFPNRGAFFISFQEDTSNISAIPTSSITLFIIWMKPDVLHKTKEDLNQHKDTKSC